MPVPDTDLHLENGTAIALGLWTFSSLQSRRAELERRIRESREHAWDLRQIVQLDSSGALLLWRGWQQRLPHGLQCTPEQKALFEALQAGTEPAGAREDQPPRIDPVSRLGNLSLALLQQLQGVLLIFGRVVLASVYLLRHGRDFPARELSAGVYHAGVQALGITALVGFLIGIVLSYLSAQQLALYGANLLIVDLLGISILRELAPLLAAILVAGRTGSAITAQLGIMKINQELDAMSALGISQTLRLAWPKVVSLMLAMPLLALWTDMLALLGGMLAAQMELGLSISQFLSRLPAAVDIEHLWIGLGKSVVFGALIGLIACHFGFSVEANSESLGRGTTASVVTGITLVILADAFFAVLLSLGEQ